MIKSNLPAALVVLFTGDDSLPPESVTSVALGKALEIASLLPEGNYLLLDENDDDSTAYNQLWESWPSDKEVVFTQWSSEQDQDFGGGSISVAPVNDRLAVRIAAGDFGPASPTSAPVYIVAAPAE